MNKNRVQEILAHDVEETPIGWIAAVAGAAGLRALVIEADRESLVERLAEVFPQSHLARQGEAASALVQLREYFAGHRRLFDLRLDLQGMTDFSFRILEALRQIPFGETATYGELAGRVGRPGAARAVGRVMASNPLPLVFPCHRVVGAGGALTGYSGGQGISTKQWLLDFEKGLL